MNPSLSDLRIFNIMLFLWSSLAFKFNSVAVFECMRSCRAQQTDNRQRKLLRNKPFVYWEVDQVLTHVAQTVFGVSILGDIQKSQWSQPQAMDFRWSSLGTGFGPDDLQRSLPTSTTSSFHDFEENSVWDGLRILH